MSELTKQAEWDESFVLSDQQFSFQMGELIGNSGLNLTQLSKRLHLGRTTLYRMLKKPPSVFMRRALIDQLSKLP